MVEEAAWVVPSACLTTKPIGATPLCPEGGAIPEAEEPAMGIWNGLEGGAFLSDMLFGGQR